MDARRSRNEGDEKYPNLKTESVFENVNPPTHAQGSDRPGRVSKALDSGQRSAVEPVDWHHIEEHRFAGMVAKAIEKVVREKTVPALVVVAPPRTLADLRRAFHADVRACIIAEIQGPDQALRGKYRETPDRGLTSFRVLFAAFNGSASKRASAHLFTHLAAEGFHELEGDFER